MKNQLVRARLENGTVVSVGPSFAQSKGLELVDGDETTQTSRKAPRPENIAQRIPQAVVDAGSTDEPLVGAALTEALKQAGLSTSGKVADKQARLAEHLAANPQTSDGDPAAGGTPTE